MHNEDISKEELQAELDAMEAAGKHHTPRKSINRKVRGNINVKKLSLVVLGIVVLLTIFVFLTSLAIEADRESDRRKKSGYVIKIVDGEFYGEQSSKLELAFDPTFDKGYHELLGLGYGDVGRYQGGSLFADLEMNTTMFDKFKDFVENKEAASTYEKDEGSANFDEYYCNKYYLRNNGKETIYYRLNLEITENNNNALDAARFMIVTGEEYLKPDGTKYNYQIFATPDKEGKQEVAANRKVSSASYNGYEYFTNPNKEGEVATRDSKDAWLCENLIKDKKTGFYNYFSCVRSETGEVLDGEMYKLEPGETVCYTICIWFEGSDPDHNNDIIGGGIKFNVKYETEEYLEYMYFSEKEKED